MPYSKHSPCSGVIVVLLNLTCTVKDGYEPKCPFFPFSDILTFTQLCFFHLLHWSRAEPVQPFNLVPNIPIYFPKSLKQLTGMLCTKQNQVKRYFYKWQITLITNHGTPCIYKDMYTLHFYLMGTQIDIHLEYDNHLWGFVTLAKFNLIYKHTNPHSPPFQGKGVWGDATPHCIFIPESIWDGIWITEDLFLHIVPSIALLRVPLLTATKVPLFKGPCVNHFETRVILCYI